MVSNYRRKTTRSSWTAENLKNAMNEVSQENYAVREAGRMYGIPERTLRRRLI